LQAIDSLIQSLLLRIRRNKAESHVTVQTAKNFKNIQVSIAFARQALQAAVYSLILTLLHQENSGVACPRLEALGGTGTEDDHSTHVG